jgi:hypothetical protein
MLPVLRLEEHEAEIDVTRNVYKSFVKRQGRKRLFGKYIILGRTILK